MGLNQPIFISNFFRPSDPNFRRPTSHYLDEATKSKDLQPIQIDLSDLQECDPGDCNCGSQECDCTKNSGVQDDQ